jgi:hypothetical protein
MTTGSTVSEMTLKTMRREIAADSPLLAEQLSPQADAGAAGFSNVFIAVRGGGDAGQSHYCFALEYIFEGYLLHYGSGRLLSTDQRDLSLLAGDYMYARGLNRIAALNDLFAVRALAELIEFCSSLHCRDEHHNLALETWAAVTICLAARAAGDRDAEEKVWPALSGFIKGALAGTVDEHTPAELIEGMLARLPVVKRKETVALLNNIYADSHPEGSPDGNR